MHVRIPEEIHAALIKTERNMTSLATNAVTDYISDPAAIAESTFYKLKEGEEKPALRDLSLNLSAKEQEQLLAVTQALHVTKQNLISNALIKRLNIDVSTVPGITPAPPLNYDPQELGRVSRRNKAIAVQEEAARRYDRTPQVELATFGDMNRVIAEAGERSVHVTAGRAAEREARRRLKYDIPEWKK